ncbi:hypothetical protein KVA01_07020 [Kocuria varians]|uniref:Secreted protein n=1 Tax=Kocuria varians TaxID=1272 RepID=A0A4Y4D5H6_KOCVA|nr:hypothetical protein [Kocuria varians]GEC98547.1 hypothetical protein KVA01_07020 [Kocuria varians]
MGVWSKLALLAAGALAGGVATRVASDPAAREAVGRRLTHPEVAPAPGEGAVVNRGPRGVERREASGPLDVVRAGVRRLQLFTARVRAGMDERESELREQFGVRAPVDHTANHPGEQTAAPAASPWPAVAHHEPVTDATSARERIIDHDPSEGNER